MDSGKHDILPVAGAILDHARVPVIMPRQSDADMRRDGPTTAQTVPNPPSMSAEECTAHRNSHAGPRSKRQLSTMRSPSQTRANPDITEQRRRRWPRRERRPRLRGQDKRTAVRRGPCGWFYSCFLSALQRVAAIQTAAKPLKIGLFLYGARRNAPKRGRFGRCRGAGGYSVHRDVGPPGPKEKEGPDGSQALKAGATAPPLRGLRP